MGKAVRLGPYLRFKEKYLESVLTGRKRVTLRSGFVRPAFSLVYIVCCGYIYGEALITKVFYTKLGAIGTDIVNAEGFSSREELIKELKELYGDLKNDDIITVIYFSLLRRYERPVPVQVGRWANIYTSPLLTRRERGGS